MSVILTFTPGWSFGADFWTALRRCLPDFESIIVTRDSAPLDFVDRPVIAIGHSAGVLWLLKERPFRWNALLSINGFTCFSQKEDFPGVPYTVTDRMVVHLKTEPEKTLTSFRKNCGQKNPVVTDDARFLPELHYLQHNDARGQDVDFPVQALAAKNDKIVTSDMTTACFDDIIWHKNGGHVLPLSDPKWCAAEIRKYVDRTV